ncbi:uncharacterized protein MCAP_0864-like [Centruroides vittatus]|uniref:uncharacterized protein MCAP_0864-like n=1 Tax=Centruroides vittatus TaxID=120091 RepID=UPI00350F8F4C
MEDSSFCKKILHGVSLTRDVSSIAEFGQKNLQDINTSNFCKDSFKRKENITENHSNVYNVNEYFASTPSQEIYQASKYAWKKDYGLSSDESEVNLIKDEIYKTDIKYNKGFTGSQNGSTREEGELSTTDLNILISDTERKMPKFVESFEVFSNEIASIPQSLDNSRKREGKYDKTKEKLSIKTEKLIIEKSGLKKNVSHLEKDSKNLEEELKKHPTKEEISEVKKKSDQLHEKIKSLNAKHMKAIDQIEHLEKIANNEYQRYNTPQNDLLKLIDELRKENENLKTCLDNFSTDAIRANNALISKINASQKSSSKLNRLVQETRRKLYSKCDEISKINEEISSHSDKSDRIKQKLDDVNEYVEQLKRNIDNIDTQKETEDIRREMNQLTRNVDIRKENLFKKRSEELIETNVNEKLGQIFKTLKEEKQNIKATARYIQKLQYNIKNEDKKLKKRTVKNSLIYDSKKFGENKISWKKKLDRLNETMEDFEEVRDKSIIDEEEEISKRKKYLEAVDYDVTNEEKGRIKFSKRFISSHPTSAGVSTMTEVYTLDDTTTTEGEGSSKQEETRHMKKPSFIVRSTGF